MKNYLICLSVVSTLLSAAIHADAATVRMYTDKHGNPRAIKHLKTGDTLEWKQTSSLRRLDKTVYIVFKGGNDPCGGNGTFVVTSNKTFQCKVTATGGAFTYKPHIVPATFEPSDPIIFPTPPPQMCRPACKVIIDPALSPGVGIQ